MEKVVVSFNKVVARDHLLVWSRCDVEFLPAGYKGEGLKRVGVSICAT
jgi:hypothetical protein